MPQNPDDPYGLGLRPLGGSDDDDPYNLGLRPLGQDTGGGFGSGYGLPSLRDIGTTAAKIPIQLGETLVGLGDIVTGGYLGKGLDYLGYDPKMTKDFIDSFESPELTAAKKQLAQAQGFGGTASALWQNPGLAALTLEESLPYLAGGAGVARGAMKALPGLSRLGASMIGEGVIGAGTQAAQIRESQGDFDWSDSPYAAGSGALTGLISGGAGRVANKFGLPDIEQMLADKSVRGVRRIPALIGGGVAEAGEESLQSGQEQAGFNLATGKPIGQGVPSAMTVGGLAGGLIGSTVPAFRSPSAPYSPVGDMSGTTQQDLPYAGLRVPEWRQPPSGLEHEGPMYGPEIGPYGIPNPNQGQLPFNIDQGGQGMLFDDNPPPFRPTPPPPPAGPLGGPPAGGEGINLNITDPNIIPPGTTLSDNQQVVTIIAPDQNNVAFWKNRGYVSVAGLVDANGKPQLVRGDVAPLFVTGDKRPAAPPPQPPAAPGAIGEGQTGIAPGEDHVVPNQVADQTGYKENMEKGGYGVALRTATHTTFREFPLAHAEGEGGPPDVEEIRATFRRMLGREPTEEEIQIAVRRRPGPGEETGRVAQFEKPDLTYPFDNQDLLNQYLALSERLDTWPGGVERRPDLVDNANRMQAELIRRGWNPQTGQFPGVPADTTPYSDKLGLTTRPISQPPPPEMGGRTAGAFPAPLGPRIPVEGYDIPGEQPPGGQGQLMPGIVQNRLENIANAPPPEGPIDLGPQPTRLDLFSARKPSDAQLIESLYQRARELGVNPDDFRSLGELEDALDNGDPGLFRREPGLPSEGGEILLGPDDFDDEEGPLGMRGGGSSRRAEIQARLQEIKIQIRDILNGNGRPMSEAVKLGVERKKLEAMLEDLPPDDVRPTIPDDIQATLDAIFKDRGNEPWIHRRGDTYDIRSKRNELRLMNEKIQHEDITPEEEARYNQLTDELDAIDNPEEPLAMGRNALTGKAVFTVNPIHSIKELTSGYNKPLPFVMVREAIQNALDAINSIGPDGRIKISIEDANTTTKKPAYIRIDDNGKGMTEEDLYTVFTTLHESGKLSDTSATGGKGVGSATYILGGQHFKIETVTLMPDGTKVKSSFAGTPVDILNPEGFDIIPQVVPDDTPTGTKIRTYLKDDQSAYDAREAIEMIVKYSRNRPGQVEVKKHSYGSSYTYEFKGNPKDKIIATDITLDRGNVKADILIPSHARIGTNTGTDVHVLNNGMWQFEKRYSYGEERNGVPSEVVIDIKPQVAELSPEYPFPTQRESLKDHIWDEVEMGIKTYVADPMAQNKQKDLAKLWQQMGAVSAPRGGTMRETVFFDPGDRLLPHELDFIKNSPSIRALQVIFDKFLDDILVARGISYDQQKLVRSGIYMPDDRYLYGHHIPNPSAPKIESGILINFFAHLQDHPNDPRTAALATIETILHEAAHIGKDSPNSSDIVISPQDMDDPRAGRYLATLLRQQQSQLGLLGHGTDWIKRLGDIYARTGTRTAFQHADAIERVFRGTGAGKGTNLVSPTGWRKSGSYSPEIQRLLQIHTESRGRPATSEDILSPTGIKSAGAGGTGTGAVPSNTRPTGGGTTAWQGVKQATGWGTGGAVTQKDKEFNWVREALAVPTNATTMLDLSAPGRQGLTMIATPEFWKATWAMFKGLSYESYKHMDADLRAKPLMRRRIDSNGRVRPSFGEEIGVKLFSPASEPGPRAEATASRWLEMGIGRTTKDAAGNKKWEPTAGSKAWQYTAGVPIRATNRAFITFLNHLNVNRTEKLLNLARDMSIRGVNTGRTAMPGLLGGIHLQGGENLGFSQKVSKEEAENLNPYHNLVLAKEIAEFVNTATGHGPLKTHYLPFKQTELNLEKHADLLGKMLFSPGLLASRARMMNPSTYIMASPFVRQQYAKAALSTAAAWFIYTQLLKYAAGPEAEIGDDITSADFGKIRVGDTRLDLGGGFLQFATAYGRAYMGGSTSSSSGEFHRFGSGYQAQTQEDMMERFMVNKLNPVAKFAWDVYSASEYNPFHVGDRTAQLFVPLFIQDLNEIAKENPDLLPIFGPAAFFGGGTQVYSKGESVAKLIPEERDWLTTGGGLRDLAPWNWGNDPGEESRPFPWSER